MEWRRFLAPYLVKTDFYPQRCAQSSGTLDVELYVVSVSMGGRNFEDRRAFY